MDIVKLLENQQVATDGSQQVISVAQTARCMLIEGELAECELSFVLRPDENSSWGFRQAVTETGWFAPPMPIGWQVRAEMTGTSTGVTVILVKSSSAS